MIWLLIGYMWIFIHRPFEVWPWIGDYHVERMYILGVIAYWTFCVPKTWTPCRSHFAVFFLAATFLLAIALSPHVTFSYVEDWFKVLVFYILVVTSVRDERDLRTLFMGFLISMMLYMSHSLLEYTRGRHAYSGMGVLRMIGVDATNSSSNMFSATIVYTLPFLIPAWSLVRAKWERGVVIAYALIAVTCILLTGSRTSFVAMGFIIFVVSMFSRYRWRIFPFFLILPPIIFISMREDLQDRYMSLIDPTRVQANARSGEGRLASFLYGMNSFAENPIFGAGIGSYRAKTGTATHNLYNQAMGEMGIFGLIVLISFAWTFFADYREAKRLNIDLEDPDELFLFHMCAAASLACLVLFLVGWGGGNLARHNWLWYGAFSGISLHFLRQRYLFIMSDEVSRNWIDNDSTNDLEQSINISNRVTERSGESV